MEKKKFDTIISGLSCVSTTKYCHGKRGQEKCTVGTWHKENIWTTVSLDGETYYIVTTLSTDILLQIVYLIKH